MRWLALLLIIYGARTASAECKQKPAGKPVYRESRAPLHAEPGTRPAPTEVLALYPDGTWVETRPSATVAGKTDTFTGCVSPFALRELTRAIGRARFTHPRGPVTTCMALPTARATYEAPRRKKRVTSDVPCGVPVDPTTGALIACVESARLTPPPADADLRAICRGT